MRDREKARQRAHELVGQMTLEEKASQLRYDAPAIPRLGVPAYNWWNEGLHGVARAGVATSFPQAIGMAAAFDAELVKEMGHVTAVEGRAKYNAASARGDRDIYKGLTFWSPNINIFRDPRWGRGHETYGEDPYLTGELGAAYVKGMQGDGEYMMAAACAKHFAVHSGPEALRHKFNAEVSEKDLRETYLPAFEKLVKEAEVEAVMGAYNRTNGEPCCGSKMLMQDILRGEWGFRGHYVSDCWAIRDFHENHMVTDTAEESAALALKCGCDVNCGITYLHLLKACQDGLVTEEEIGRAAERLFTTRFLLGLFDETEYDKIGYDRIECKEHLETAARATAESLVLLKNNGILPLDKKAIKTVGVIGPNADSRSALIGNYHGTSSRYITVLEGIQDYVQEDVRVYYSEGCHLFGEKVEGLAWRQDRISEAVSVAKNSDVVILCLGLDETLEGEEGDAGNGYASGDKVDLALPQVQRELAEAVLQVGKPVVLLNMTGSAMDLRYFQEHADAVLQVWYPGARGGKVVAKALFGEISPSGKLPVTFYNSADELPAFEEYSMKGRTYRYFQGKPLYPFGYGLTYGDVAVESAECGGHSWEAGTDGKNGTFEDGKIVEWAQETLKTAMFEDMTVSVTLSNKSNVATGEVVQVYVKYLDGEDAAPNGSLAAFERVFLSGGERKSVAVRIGKERFAVIDKEGRKTEPGGRFLVSIGLGQPDERTRELTGKENILFVCERG
ncbi:MAG: glycoside hydrolase family 3 protein [Lachnospiraceae bacterium]|nr:glycoside hydrolase family 3 C-terminal domain-containing protein [uncultured Acetatifactor sp.]MCI9219216.1 glycoside hydrolase family 3 protein [Lachnospiraceae bacterium]